MPTFGVGGHPKPYPRRRNTTKARISPVNKSE